MGPLADPAAPDPLHAIEEADAALVGSLFPGVAATFERARKLKVIARFGIGIDNIDVAAATDRGICVINTPDAPTESAAEFAIGLMLMVARRIKTADRHLGRGAWLPIPNVTGFDLAGKTLGMVGLGRIGGRVADLARIFHMQVMAHDPYVRMNRAREANVTLASDLATVLDQADILSIHAPLTPETHHLISAPEFAQMKPGAILINVARGPIVHEQALVDALHNKHLAGAALDVWDTEPPRPDNPLLHMENVVVTPHMAAATQEGRQRSNTSAAKQALAVLRGEKPSDLVNPEVWPIRRR